MSVDTLMGKIPNEVLEYIDKFWKPNQDDAYVVVERNSDLYNKLKDAFEFYLSLTPTEQDAQKFEVGPFVGICPFGIFDVEADINRVEFLFDYEKIDNTKIKKQHLTID